jgi:DNA repair protein RecO (recombination protein O)
MINKTQGIVLNHIPYGESSIIARIYTQHYGYQGFIVNNVRSSRSKQSIAYFQPFTLLDLVVYWKNTRDIQRISEYKSLVNWHADDIRKQAVLLFLGEVLDKLLRNEHTENPSLYSFVNDSIQYFKKANSTENFHLSFLLKLTEHLGITIGSGSDLFENMDQVMRHDEMERLINELLANEYDGEVEASGDLRFQSLGSLMEYFRHHVPGFGEVKSLKVLKQIFR